MERIEILKRWVSESSRIVFFGGAGVSTESGIPAEQSWSSAVLEAHSAPAK